MAKLKPLKYPKKPKRSASAETKEKFLARVRAIDGENKRRKSENDRSDKLSQVIAGIGTVKTFSSGFSAKSIRPSKVRRKKSPAKKSRKRRK